MTDPDKLDRPVLMHHIKTLSDILHDAPTDSRPIIGTASAVRAACECAKLPEPLTELGHAIARLIEKASR